jgi:hypothetical protein
MAQSAKLFPDSPEHPAHKFPAKAFPAEPLNRRPESMNPLERTFQTATPPLAHKIQIFLPPSQEQPCPAHPFQETLVEHP